MMTGNSTVRWIPVILNLVWLEVKLLWCSRMFLSRGKGFLCCGETDFSGLLVERFATLHSTELRGVQGRSFGYYYRRLFHCHGIPGNEQGIPHQGKIGRNDASGGGLSTPVLLPVRPWDTKQTAELTIPILSWPTARSTMLPDTYMRSLALPMTSPEVFWRPCLSRMI